MSDRPQVSTTFSSALCPFLSLDLPPHNTSHLVIVPRTEVVRVDDGKVRLTVVSKAGKEATLAILGKGEFFGEGGLAGQPLRMGSATALTDCELLRIDKKAMVLALHREHKILDLFVAYLLARNIRYEEDLVDQLFNSSEKRLARLLLFLAHFGKEGTPETVIPKTSQERSRK